MTIIEWAGMGQVLVLNASYEPLNITTWRRAVAVSYTHLTLPTNLCV